MSLPFGLPPLQPALHRLGNRDCLRQRKAHRGIDADAAISGLFDRRNSRARRWDLDNHVRGQPVEPDGLRQHRIRVAIVPWICLNRETAVAPFLAIEDRLQQPGRIRRHLLHNHPRNLILCCLGKRVCKFQNAALPNGHLLLEHSYGDGGVACGAHGPMLN